MQIALMMKCQQFFVTAILAEKFKISKDMEEETTMPTRRYPVQSFYINQISYQPMDYNLL